MQTECTACTFIKKSVPSLVATRAFSDKNINFCFYQRPGGARACVFVWERLTGIRWRRSKQRCISLVAWRAITNPKQCDAWIFMRLCAACRGTCTPQQQTIKQTINIGKWREEERKKRKTNSDFVWTRFLLLLFQFDSRIIMIRCVYRIYQSAREKIRQAHAGTKMLISETKQLQYMNWRRYLFIGAEKETNQCDRAYDGPKHKYARMPRTHALRERAIIIKQLNNRTSAQIKVRDRQCAQEIVIYISFVWRSQESCVCEQFRLTRPSIPWSVHIHFLYFDHSQRGNANHENLSERHFKWKFIPSHASETEKNLNLVFVVSTMVAIADFFWFVIGAVEQQSRTG